MEIFMICFAITFVFTLGVFKVIEFGFEEFND